MRQHRRHAGASWSIRTQAVVPGLVPGTQWRWHAVMPQVASRPSLRQAWAALLGDPFDGWGNGSRQRVPGRQHWCGKGDSSCMRSEERRVGKELPVRVEYGGRRRIKKKKQNK